MHSSNIRGFLTSNYYPQYPLHETMTIYLISAFSSDRNTCSIAFKKASDLSIPAYPRENESS